jgi:hypothetical protein
LEDYFFLYPVGQAGFKAVTFFESLPFTQVMVTIFFGLAIAIFGVGESTTASCINLIRIVGAEKPNPFTSK